MTVSTTGVRPSPVSKPPAPRGRSRLLLPGIVAYAPVTILVVYLSIRRARPRLSLFVSIVGLVVTTGMSVVLIPPYGASGAAVASAIGYAAGAAWVCFVRLARTG
jgi:O-antigen/teichoic acid export membrane protein